MNPQPPVTRMRMAARTSSAEQSAPAEFPMLRSRLEQWKPQLAETDWIPWVILGLAVFLRFFLLGIKPPHFDEGINGWFVDQVMKNGFYRYDPTNYHGPLHFYVLLLSEALFGRNVWALRLPVVLVSIGCAALAIPALMVSNALNRLSDEKPAQQTWTYVDLAVVIGVGIAAIVFFYSGTFFHWSGVKGIYQAYAAWFATGHEGHGHEKSWYYWLELIGRCELPVAGGLVLCLFCQQFKNFSLRY